MAKQNCAVGGILWMFDEHLLTSFSFTDAAAACIIE
jgi:hypothetical protein